MGIFLLQVVSRALPIPIDKHPKNHRMKLCATNEVRPKSRFWYFPSKPKNFKKSDDQVLAINEGQYQDSLNALSSYFGRNLQCRMRDIRRSRKHFKLRMVPQRASLFATLYQRLQLLFNASPKVLSFERKVLKVTCWQEKFILGIDTVLSCVVASMLFIVLASVTVSKAPTWALTEDNRLFLEAWRTVDRAYFDKSFNGQSWFRYRENALRTEPMNNREETCML